MKKALLFVVGFLAVSAGAMAQSVAGFQLGVKAGFNDSGYLGKDSESDRWENRYGGHAGIFMSIPVTAKTFQIQPELLYSMKGAKHFTNSSAGSDENDFKVQQHHLDIPVLAIIRARFFYFEIGPVASVMLAASVDPNPAGADITDEFRRFGIGGAGGAGIMIEQGLMLGARYSADFNKLLKEDMPNRRNYHNSLFQIYVGYLFGGRPGAELSTESSDRL